MGKNDNNNDKLTAEEARRSLDSIRGSGKRIVDQLHVPWWHDPLLGLCLALLVMHHGFPTPLDILSVVLGCLGVFFVLHNYTHQKVWVSGWRKGKTEVVSYIFFVVYLIVFAASYYFNWKGYTWVVPLSGAFIFVALMIFGRVWMAVWRKEMEESE